LDVTAITFVGDPMGGSKVHSMGGVEVSSSEIWEGTERKIKNKVKKGLEAENSGLRIPHCCGAK
jgi:hypothetical protein